MRKLLPACLFALALAPAASAQTWNFEYGWEYVGSLGDRIIVTNRGNTFVCSLAEVEGGLQLTDCLPVLEPAQ